MPENNTLEKRGISRKHPCFPYPQALKNICLLEACVDHGQAHYETTVLDMGRYRGGAGLAGFFRDTPMDYAFMGNY